MVRVTLIQLSDRSISAPQASFEPNRAPLRAWTRQKADLVIHGDDVTVDGADDGERLFRTAPRCPTLLAPVLAVPGNHTSASPGIGINPVSAVGSPMGSPSRHRLLVARRRRLAANGLTHSSSAAARRRRTPARLADTTMAEARGRRLAWFLHMPLLSMIRRGRHGLLGREPEPRAPLLTSSGESVALVATGMSIAHDRRLGETRFVWAPSSGFVVGPALQPAMAGESRLGVVLYRFEGSEVEVEINDVEGLIP